MPYNKMHFASVIFTLNLKYISREKYRTYIQDIQTAVTQHRKSTLKDTYGNCITYVNSVDRGIHEGDIPI